MTEEENKREAQALYDAAEKLHKEAQSDFAGDIRTKMFTSFEEARSYYRNEPIKLMQSAMKQAVDDRNEDLVVDSAERLYEYIALEKMTTGEKKMLWDDCLRPILDWLGSAFAKGKLYYYLGKLLKGCGFNGDEDFKKAIELDYKEIMEDDEVFSSNPDFIFVWLRKYLGDGDDNHSKRAENYQLEYNKLTREGKRGAYCLQLAKLHKERGTGQANGYFRECIGLGVEEVAYDPEFLCGDYEKAYIEWFKSSIKFEEPLKAKEKCFAKLWEHGELAAFSESHQCFAESLYKYASYSDAIEEFQNCAKAGLPWATDFLFRHLEEKEVYDKLSDEFIRYLYDTLNVGDARTVKALGFLLNERQEKESISRLATTCKGRCCICFYYLEAFGGGAVRKALGFFREAESIFAKAQTVSDLGSAAPDSLDFDTDFCKKIRLKIFELVREQGLYKNLLIEQFNQDKIFFANGDPLLKNIGTLSESAQFGTLKVNPQFRLFLQKRPIDGALQQYFDHGELNVSIFRQPGDIPSYRRYLLLKQFARLAATAYYNAPECINKNFERQKLDFEKQAEKEWQSLIQEHDYFTLLATVIEYMSGKEVTRGTAAIYAMILAITPDESVLPYLILVNMWAQDETKADLIQLLRLLIENDELFEKFYKTKDRKEVLSLIFSEYATSLRELSSNPR